jgi:hypothetical protein
VLSARARRLQVVSADNVSDVAMHQHVTKNAASRYMPPVLEGKIAPRVKAGNG